jgi:predicted PolB exonuclease-like 3'-5' exonuclease
MARRARLPRCHGRTGGAVAQPNALPASTVARRSVHHPLAEENIAVVYSVKAGRRGGLYNPRMPATLVLDIETVPDLELHAPPELPPGVERPFPPLYACKPVVLAVMWLDESLSCTELRTVGDGGDEDALLSEFSGLMSRHRPRIVSWNGRTFDLPVLTLRALRHGVAFPWYFEDPASRERHSTTTHLDLCDFLANHGAARMTSLDAAARLIGLPGKDGMDGSQVEALHASGQHEALRQYCLSDVVQTAFLFLRTRLLTGETDRAAYRRASTALLETVAGPLPRLAAGVDRARLLLTGGGG